MNYIIRLFDEQICEADELYEWGFSAKELKDFIEYEVGNDVIFHLACESYPDAEIEGQEDADKFVKCEDFKFEHFNINRNQIEACGKIIVRYIKDNKVMKYDWDFWGFVK
mgnify:CR=1 FL=1